MSKIQKLFRGSALNTIALFFNIVILFFLFPFIVDKLGTRLYGLWELVSSLTGYYFLLDFGISTAVSRFIARAIGMKKHNEIISVLSNSVVLFGIMSFISILITTVLIFSISAFVNYELKGLTQLLIALVGLEFAISLPLRVYQGVLKAYLDFDILSGIEITKVAIRSLLIVIFLNNGYGIIVLAIISVVINIIFHLSILSLARIRYNVTLSRYHIAWHKMRELFHFSKHVFFAGLGGVIRFRIDHFIIAGFLGLPFVTVYAVASRIIDFFIKIVQNVTGVLTPIFSMYEGEKNFDSIRNSFVTGVKLSTIISSFIGANLIIYGKFFIENWMGKNFLGAYPVLAILAFALTIALSQVVGIGVLQSVNKHKWFSIIVMIESASNLILTLILVTKFGIVGVAMGTAIPMILTKIFLQPYIVCKSIRLPFKVFLDEMFCLMFSLILFYTGTYSIIHFIVKVKSMSYIYILLQLLLQLLVFLFIIFFVLKPREKEMVLSVFDLNKKLGVS
jgi:O-antigen/teichoic acid export membrane protein